MNVSRLVVCILFSLTLCACNGNRERERAEKVAADSVRAIAADDRDALKELMTAQMYTDYVNALAEMQRAAILLAGFGKTMPKPGDIELVSATCDRIEDGKAYVHTETRVRDKTNFETMVLKRESGQWKVAGKE